MKVTGRLPAKKAASDKAMALAGGDDINRQTRVSELRSMVRAKRYKVDSQKLAVRIFARAMSRAE
jgi:anti-sigma28 factor (negative regulator of flagellin synthesis)